MPESVHFDHYEVLTRDDGSLFELGRGAMGITYKAVDTNLRIPVALKVINAVYLHSEVARQRFIREARSAARLRNPHVAAVYHLGTEGEHYYYAMEFIDGETVDGLIKRQGPLSPAVALEITDQVARALQAAEPHGLVHRDLKPANLMLLRDGEELIVKVIDFGLAKSTLSGDGEESATISFGGFVGTPHFASPEQLEERDIDLRSDIYSLGITLWYMLAGQTPFAGSMAQVMSQHLSPTPPFEQLRVPPALTELLRRMLEKDAANRPASAAVLRQEIEECLKKLGGAADQPLPSRGGADVPEDFVTRVDAAALPPGTTRFVIGATVAARYRLVEDLGDSNAGEVFRAQDLSNSRDVRIVVLHRQIATDPALLGALERDVEKAAACRHPHLVQVHALESVDGGSFVVQEWTRGATLLEVLRARRALEPGEALSLLNELAGAVDHALAAGLTRLPIELHQIVLHLEDDAADKEPLLPEPLERWPRYTAKLHPIAPTRSATGAESLIDAQTVVGGIPVGEGAGADPQAVAVRALAALTYEMLGGNLSPLGLGTGTLTYSPLAAISEGGNAVLQRALAPQPDFSSAAEFYAAISSPEGIELRRPEARSPVAVKVETANPKSTPRSSGSAMPESRRIPRAFFNGLFTIGLIGSMVWFLARTPVDEADLPPLPPEPGVTAASPPEEASDLAPAASSEPPPSQPPTGPSRRESLNAAVERAKAMEEQQSFPEAISAWVQVAREYPEFAVGRSNLEAVIGGLRKRPHGMPPEEFAAMEDAIVADAQLDVLAAMLLLGDQYRKTRPADSFAWFSAAAAKENLEAMTQVGLMFSNGLAGERDLEKALYYFTEAAERGHPAAITALGDCYLYGKGVAKDEARGVQLLRQAAEARDGRAMDLLATCYDRGLGVQKSSAEAAKLYQAAAEAGYFPAFGNLGVLQIKGAGAKPDPQRAVEFFRKGVDAGDGYSMFLLAQCFESGTGISANREEAQRLYINAAKTGNPQAISWCQKNGVRLE